MTKELKLPQEFEYLIAMTIRKQIKEYAFSSIQNFADSHLKTKNYIFNTDTQFPHKNQLMTSNLARRSNLNIDSSKFKGKDKNDSQMISSMIKKQEIEEDRELVELASFIFENKIEKELGPLHNLKYTTRDSKHHKPQVLKNHSKKRKKTNENSIMTTNTLINNKILFSDINKIIISKQAIVMGKNYDIITIDKAKIEKYLN